MEAKVKEFEAISWNPSGEIELSMADSPPAEKKIFFTENYNSNYYYFYDYLHKSITFQSSLISKTCHVHILHRVEILFHLHETRWDRGNVTMTHGAREVVEPVMEISSFGIFPLSSLVFCLFCWSNSKPHWIIFHLFIHWVIKLKEMHKAMASFQFILPLISLFCYPAPWSWQ